jgi:hypothetical protein
VRKNFVIKAAAWLEVIVGVTLIAALDIASRLLFGAVPTGPGAPLGRIAGIALFALGVAGLRSTDAGSYGSAALSLFIFNAGAAIFLALVDMTTATQGVLLIPAVVLHAAMACALLWTFRGGTHREA